MATIETNWDEIPAEYRFTAVDKYGPKYAYIKKPFLDGGEWLSHTGQLFLGTVEKPFCWGKSLRERPSVVSTMPSYHGVSVTGASNIFMQHNMIFHNEDGDVGKLEWANGILEFSGDATESAKVFMDELQRQFHTAIEIEIERRVNELQFNGESDE